VTKLLLKAPLDIASTPFTQEIQTHLVFNISDIHYRSRIALKEDSSDSHNRFFFLGISIS
jgi:hypothetical protein